MEILITLAEAMAVFLVLSYVYCRSPGFPDLDGEPLRPRVAVVAYLFFTAVTILGTYLGRIVPAGSIANTRGVGAVLAGLIGGPVLGCLVGGTAGVHRAWVGGITGVSGGIATTVEGLIAGLVHVALRRRPDRLFSARTAALTALGSSVVHQLLQLALARPFAEAVANVRVIAFPMIVSNTCAAALFMVVMRDQQATLARIAAASSAVALRIAERATELLARGYGPAVATELATVILEETRVGAVAITDSERLLAFSGIGSDHHRSGQDIGSPWTRRALATHGVVLLDGVRERYQCAHPGCPLHAAVVVPLVVDGAVVGTVQLFERKRLRLGVLNRRLGEGIGALLSSQMVHARYQEQKSLLLVSELKLLQAQVDPHFLFNSLNTIVAITRIDPGRARELLLHLASFFRKNLKRSSDLSTLEEELAHVHSYLEIEKARFPDRLTVETEVDPELLGLRMPTFTLQPLVENAIKHGLSTTPNPGVARVHAYRKDGSAFIDIEDDAGTWVEPDFTSNGHGMKIVDRRIKNLHGPSYGLTVDCVPSERTRVTVRLPTAGS